jgi:hypothetical protein
MRSQQHNLIARLIERAGDSLRAVDNPKTPYRPLPEKYPPLSPQHVSSAEARLGFQLPPLLRAIYLQVSNGGFGPGYGLIGLDGGPTIYGKDLVSLYLDMLEHGPPPPYHAWPKQFITICDWGCNMTSELDWSSPDAPIFFFDGNQYEPEQPWETAMTPEAPSFYVWLENWLNK